MFYYNDQYSRREEDERNRNSSGSGDLLGTSRVGTSVTRN